MTRLKLTLLFSVLLFILLSFTHQQETYNFDENNRIFLYYPSSDSSTTRFINLKNTYPIGSKCGCSTVTGTSDRLDVSGCVFDSENSLTVVIGGTGFCNLTIVNGSETISSEIDSFVVISDLYISPNGRELRTDIAQQFELKYYPSSISFSTFSMFFDKMSNSIRSSIAPIYSFSITKSANSYHFTIPASDTQSMLQLTSYDSLNRYKKIDFEVVLDSNSASPTTVPVTDGILFYNSISGANIKVSPTLIRFNEVTTLTFSIDSTSSGYLFSPTNSLTVKICGTIFQSSELFKDSSSSQVTIVSETLVKATITCSDSAYKNGKTSVGYSQGGADSQFVNMDLNIYDFNVPPTINYDGTSFCSIFGLNNFTLTIPQETNFYREVTNNSVRLSLFELEVKNSPYSLACNWLASDARILSCPCPSTFEYLFTPPQELNFYLRTPTMAASLQEQKSLGSGSIVGNPKILYGQYLTAQINSPTAMYSFKFKDGPVYSNLKINVVDIEEIYVPSLFNYTFYLSTSNILNNAFIISCSYSYISQAGKNGISCDMQSFYQVPKMNVLCACTLAQADTIAPLDCLANCDIRVGIAITKDETSQPIAYWTSNSFSLMPPLVVKTIYPDTILLDSMNQVAISIFTSSNSFGKPTPGNTIYYKWIEIDPATGQELIDQYEGTATYVNAKQLALSTVSANTISASGTYILKLSFDGKLGTFSTDHGVRRLNVIIPSEISLTKFEQYNLGVNNTAIPAGYSDDTISPVESKFRIIGTNFPMSETIKIKFTVVDQQNSINTRSILAKMSRKNYRQHIRSASTKIQKRSIQEQLALQESTGSISFLSDCSGFSSTEIRCTSPNVFTSGILLPLKFNVSISFDGSFGFGVYNPKKDGNDYLITVRESEVPVIVQAIPSRAPINPTDDSKGVGYFTVTLKGITTDVVRCVLEYSIDTNIRVNYTATSGLSSTEFRCICNAADLKSLIDSYNVRPFNSRISFPDKTNFKIYLETTTNLRSDGFLFELFENPIVDSVSPLEIEAKGGDMVTVRAKSTGAKFSSSEKIYFKLGDFTSSEECLFLEDYAINCTSPSHPDGYAKGSVSYNNYQYAYAKDPIFIKACPVGFTAEDYEKSCTECPIGQYKPLEGFFSCIPCEVGSYNNLTAQSKCVSCGAFKTTLSAGSSSQFNCDCEKGYYRRNDSDILTAECWPCPTGATCEGGSSLPKPLPGYWWDAETTKIQNGKIVIVKCDEPNAELRCPGNLTLAGRCATGYSGIKCVSCVTGLYFKSGDICKECNTDVQLRFLIVVAVVIIIALVLFKFAQLKVSHLSSASIAISYFQIIAVFTVYNFEWPDSLQQAFDTLKFFNLNLDIFVPECIEIITYGLKWGLTIAMPVFISVLLIIVFGLECLRTVTLSKLPFIAAIRKHPKVVEWFNIEHKNIFIKIMKGIRRDILRYFLTPRSKREIIAYGDKFIHTFIVVISFSYVFVITKAAEIFDCREVLDQGVKRFYVSADTTLYCFENTWWVYFSFALLTFIFFGLGTIALFAYIIWKKNDATKSYKFYARFRFLFVRFRNGRLFWEIIVILRKLAISAAIIFFSTWPIIVILFTMFVIFISFILQTHHVPYRRVFHNVMEYIVLLSTEFLLFSGLLFYVNEFPDEATGSALGYLCIISVIISSAAIILLIALDFLSQYLADRRIKKQLAEKQKNQKAILSAGVNNSFLSSNDIELKEENSKSQTTQVELTEKSATTIVDIPSETPVPQTTTKAPLKIRLKKGMVKLWERFVKYLKKIEGESLDVDLDEYDDNRLWDVELMDRGLPIPVEPTFVDSNGNLSKKEEDSNSSSSKQKSDKAVVFVDENEIKLESDVSSSSQSLPTRAVDPRTFSRLVGRSESDISLQSGSSQQNLLQ